MADATTTNYLLVEPEVGASADSWGTKWNNNLAALDKLMGAITTGGSGAAYTLTTGQSLTAYATGQTFRIKASFTSNAAATLNVDGIGAKNITKNGTTATVSGDIVSGNIYTVAYDGSGFQVNGPVATGTQPLDATLTALAALSWSSGNALVQFTAADTVSLTLTPSVTTLSVPDGTAAAPSIKVGDEQNGLLSPAANQLAITLGGTQRVVFAATNINYSSAGQLIGGAGTVSAPTLVVRSADLGTGWYSIGTNNWGWAGNGTKYADWSSTLFDFIAPTRAPLAVSSETSGTLTTASANKKVKMSGDCTINDGVFAANDWIIFENNSASTRQIIQDTGMTLRLHGSTSTGTRTVAVRGGASVGFDTNAEAIVYGDVT